MKIVTACLLSLLVIGLSGCAQLLPSHKDEDILAPVTKLLAVHRDEDILPSMTKSLPTSRIGSSTTTITEKGRDPRAVEWLRQSTLSLEKGSWPETIRTADAAIALEPDLDDALVNRGLAYYYEGVFERAIADCSRAISVNPDNVLAYACRGLALRKRDGTSRRGDADLAHASQLAKAVTSQVIVGGKEDEIAKFGAACAAGVSVGCTQYKRLVGRYPAEVQKRLDALLDESLQRFVARDWDNVIQSTTEVLRIDDESVVALCNRSGAYANKGLLKEALADSNAAIAVRPDFILAYNNRGWAKELSSQMKDALLDYDAACSRGLDIACKNAARLRATGKVN